MCGFTGFVDFSRQWSADALRSQIAPMGTAIRHRGPDDAGDWVEPATGVALGHRRLSILDLSPNGHQPMVSHDGRWVIVYNGEVYNHDELRRDLSAHGGQFRGTSDTETLVEGISRWGVEQTVRRCRGIFALAVYDTRERTLTLVRDQLGVKPVYYGQQGRVFLFGSELKALRAHPAFTADIDRAVLPQYLRHNYVPGPHTIYRGIRKLPPGTLLTIRVDQESHAAIPETYWSFTETALHAAAAPLTDDAATITAKLESTLQRVIREQMLSDVPLGAFLSGGIDSSLVVALMQEQSTRPVQTFTIGFDVDDYNEAPFAAAVAKHLGTQHTEHYVTAAEALDVIPRLPAMFDEPFADSSQIPTFLVSQLARRHVTVTLSGDGGDELFCGYLRYFAPLFGLRGGLLPGWVRHPAAWSAGLAAHWMPTEKWRKFCRRAASFLADADPDQRYLRGMTHWPLGSGIVASDPVPAATMFLDPQTWPSFPERQQRWMWLDTLNYLPDDILVKVDRASMAVSLESRVPLLDPSLVELAWQIPHAMKTHRWTGKQILRDLLAKRVPRSLFERPKKGFGVPIAHWLRGPLKDWGAALLDPRRLQQEGYFNPALVDQTWQDHQTSRHDRAYQLWDVLMFQAWMEGAELRVES
jgi:asparagine synthase (glutamine-hydrolysing)